MQLVLASATFGAGRPAGGTSENKILAGILPTGAFLIHFLMGFIVIYEIVDE